MKSTFVLVAFLFMLTGIAHADAYFAGQSLSALRVIQTNPGNGTAEISAAGAATATVRIGDTVGQSAAAVIKIGNAYLVVQAGKQKTRLPVVQNAVPDGSRIIFQ